VKAVKGLITGRRNILGRYFVVIREGYGKSAGYSFLDMDATFSSQHTDVTRWTTIKVDTPNVLVFAFASELDLAVAISCGTQHPGPSENNVEDLSHVV